MSVIRPDTVSRQLEPPYPTADHPSRRRRPVRQSVTGPLFDARFRQLIDHLHQLGPRPISELLRELIGRDEQVCTDLFLLLERYYRLDPSAVEAVGSDRFTPSRFRIQGGGRSYE